jgi:putative membrane protein
MSPDPNESPAAQHPSCQPAVTRAGADSLLARFRRGLAVALGLGRRGSAGTAGVDQGTLLAIERSYLAADRTLMAWIRTALSMISFGFTVGKLGQTVSQIEIQGALRGVRMVSVEEVAYALVVIGTAALFGALLQYLISIAEYAEAGLRHRISISFFVGVLLVVMGGLAFTSLVMRL